MVKSGQTKDKKGGKGDHNEGKDLAKKGQQEKGKKKQRKEVESNQEEVIDYASKDYWNERYCAPCVTVPSDQKEENILSHEWYYSFEDLSPLFLKQDILIHRSQDVGSMRILEVGCGNQPLLPGFLTLSNEEVKLNFQGENLYGIDFSDQVIEQLNNNSTSSIHYECKDARKLSYGSDSFDIIIDKGTMDAMLSEKDQKKGIINAKLMVKEMIRCVTTKHGLIMIVSHIEPESEEFSLLLEDILMPAMMDLKVGVVWKLHVHSGGKDENGEPQGGTVYCITCTEKRSTRSKNSSPNEVFVEFFEYDSDEEEEEEEEEEVEAVVEVHSKRKRGGK